MRIPIDGYHLDVLRRITFAGQCFHERLVLFKAVLKLWGMVGVPAVFELNDVKEVICKVACFCG